MKNRYDSEATINDILNVSTQLFLEKGYEKTSIQDIVNHLDGLTRGAIYHHFENKESILNAVTRRLFLKDDYFEELKHRNDLNGLQKLQSALLDSIMNDDIQRYATRGYALLKNPRFYVEYLKVNSQVVSPQVEQLLILGNCDGSLNVKHPKYVAEVIVLLLTTWFTLEIYPVDMDAFNQKLEAAQYILENIGIDILGPDFINTLREYERKRK